jgi:hypothetical protein
MKLDKLIGGIAQSGDPGAFLKQELEEGLEPITKRVDALERKLDLIILTLGRIEAGLKTVQPVIDFVKKLPFFK